MLCKSEIPTKFTYWPYCSSVSICWCAFCQLESLVFALVVVLAPTPVREEEPLVPLWYFPVQPVWVDDCLSGMNDFSCTPRSVWFCCFSLYCLCTGYLVFLKIIFKTSFIVTWIFFSSVIVVAVWEKALIGSLVAKEEWPWWWCFLNNLGVHFFLARAGRYWVWLIFWCTSLVEL